MSRTNTGMKYVDPTGDIIVEKTADLFVDDTATEVTDNNVPPILEILPRKDSRKGHS